MSNTGKYKGDVYEIGKAYEFSDDGEKWVVCRLMSIVSTKHPFESKMDVYKQIRAIEPSSIGTITKAPVKLENGNYYLVDTIGEFKYKRISLRYCATTNKFHLGDIVSFCMDDCTNIVKLVPEVSNETV